LDPNDRCGLDVLTKVAESKQGQELIEETEMMLSVEIRSELKNHKPSYAFVLTDRSNPLFFYQVSIDEDSFIDMKQDQHMLIDFHGLPDKVMSLLKLCADSSSGGGDLDGLTYFATMDVQQDQRRYEDHADERAHVHEAERIRFNPKTAVFSVW